MIRLLKFKKHLFCTATNKIYGIASLMGGKSTEGLYEQYSQYHNKDL